MDSSVLRRLATEGLASGVDLGDLAVWCRDHAEATGDARYSSLSETFRAIDEWMTEHDDSGGVPATLTGEIDRLIRSWLPDVLDAAEPSAAAQTARLLRQEVAANLLPPEQW